MERFDTCLMHLQGEPFPMSRIPSFVRTRGDGRAVAAAHRRHGSAPHFGCPLCAQEGVRPRVGR